MKNNSISKNTKISFLALVLVSALIGGGCSGVAESTQLTGPVDTTHSPKPVYMPLKAAWDLAHEEAQTLPGGDVVVGSGDSMMPLYSHRTVLVIQQHDYEELKVGMTVVFYGDHGFPVAHNLVAKTDRGWQAAGVGNGYLDRTRVTPHNYIGTAVKAYSANDRSTETFAANERPGIELAGLANHSG